MCSSDLPWGVGQQADDDLQLAALAIAVVAELPEFVLLAFQIAAGDVVEKQTRRWCTPAALVAGVQSLLDLFLSAHRSSSAA